MTLAIKYKLKTLSKTFQKLGRGLTCTMTAEKNDKKFKLSILSPEYLPQGNLAGNLAKSSPSLRDLSKTWNAKFSSSNLYRSCIICGAEKGIEMHHVRKIRDLKNRNSKLDFFTRQMAAINRKQIPLCRTHHGGLHNGSWTSEERQIFVDKTRKRG